MAAERTNRIKDNPITVKVRDHAPRAASIPAVESRLRIDDNDNFIDELGRVVDDRFSARRVSASAPVSAEVEALIERTVERLYRRFGSELGNLVELQREIEGDDYVFCHLCSHDACKHYHARRPYSRADVESYIPTTKQTIYSWLHDGAMPRPISGPPYEWDQHAIACFKLDKVIFSNGHYDKAEHLRLLKTARVEQEAKRKAKSAKLSAHMVRENARRRKAKKGTTRNRKGGAQ